MKIIRIILLPISYLYGAIVAIRNLLYDFRIFSSKTFGVNIISVGNLSVGGTGKTPHIEYLIRLLNSHVKDDKTETTNLATLSRGYKRKTTGFLIANENSTALQVGDEPLQFKKKFPWLCVSVSEDRTKGVHYLLDEFPEINTILLDDAFQHRKIKPDISILLTDYYNLYTDDYVVPCGRLREFKSGSSRADIIIVTKTPKLFTPLERRIVKEQLQPETYQNVYFSYIEYGKFTPLLKSPTNISNDYYFDNQYFVILVTGIAKPQPLVEYIKSKTKNFQHIMFEDHHTYTTEDIKKIKNLFDNIAVENKIVLTTEKDAMRFYEKPLSDLIIDLPMFYVPIEIKFHEKDNELFDNQILEHVKRNTINSELHKRQH